MGLEEKKGTSPPTGGADNSALLLTRRRSTNKEPDSQDQSPGVAGRLSLFPESWACISDSSFVLQTIKGYHLEFKTKPPIMSPREAATMETSFKGETKKWRTCWQRMPQTLPLKDWVLQPNLLHPKERWASLPDHQPKTPQSLHVLPTFPHAHSLKRVPASSGRRLGHQVRSEGCVFPRAYLPSPQTVPEIPLE